MTTGASVDPEHVRRATAAIHALVMRWGRRESHIMPTNEACARAVCEELAAELAENTQEVTYDLEFHNRIMSFLERAAPFDREAMFLMDALNQRMGASARRHLAQYGVPRQVVDHGRSR